MKVLDLGPLSIGQLPHRSQIEVVREDLRNIVNEERNLKELLTGCDCVIHLAAVSSDKAAENNPALAEEINAAATQRLAEAAKAVGARFVFSSSCAVYGSVDGEADEAHPLSPLSEYSVSKTHAEQALSDLRDETWAPITLRNGTLFGYSPRMRFDLVVNVFSLHSTLRNHISVFAGGRQWRPFVHVDDCARAFVHFSEHPRPQHICYNIAWRNLRVVDLIEYFKNVNPRLEVTVGDDDGADERDYRVLTQRASKDGFEARIGIQQGIEELVQAMVAGLLPDPESSSLRFPKWGDGATGPYDE